MPAPTSAAPRRNWMASINVDNGAGLRQSIQVFGSNVPTTGAIQIYITAPEDGYLHSVDMTSDGALAANDTNYITWDITNLGQSGSGTTVMTAVSDANTTKATGGTGVVVNARKVLVLSSVPSNLKVQAGDRIRIRATVTGTLGGVLSTPTYLARFSV